MPSPNSDKRQKIVEAANAIALARDCDVLIVNSSVEFGLDLAVHKFLQRRKRKKKNVLVFLVTEGGDADAAYRIARHLQDTYESITIAVSGWCKSAGTLMCIAAHELIIFDTGELGPLDVQIAKADELGEQSSGLAAEAAFEKLQQEAFKMFERHLTHIKEDLKGRITFRTAADLSAQLVVGLMAGIFEKIEPMALGEDYRSNLIAREYATRLNLAAQNLNDRGDQGAIDMLLNGYPSHRFVIDRKEASNLFRRVSSPSATMVELADLLGGDAIFPLSHSRNQQIRLEYLNDETSPRAKAKAAKGRKDRRPARTGVPRTVDISGSVSAGAGQEPRLKPAA